MRIWTVQSAAAWRVLAACGRLEARRHHRSELWTQAYDRMREALAQSPCSPSEPPPGGERVRRRRKGRAYSAARGFLSCW